MKRRIAFAARCSHCLPYGALVDRGAGGRRPVRERPPRSAPAAPLPRADAQGWRPPQSPLRHGLRRDATSASARRTASASTPQRLTYVTCTQRQQDAGARGEGAEGPDALHEHPRRDVDAAVPRPPNESGHDHFFATFGKFSAVTRNTPAGDAHGSRRPLRARERRLCRVPLRPGPRRRPRPRAQDQSRARRSRRCGTSC